MINRIHICGYKSLIDVDIPLKQLSVLFGPNAAGKSNFLDALQLFSRIATCKTLREAFEPPYRGKPLESFALPPGGLPDLLKQEEARFSIEADITLSDRVASAVNRQIQEMRKGAAGNGDNGDKKPKTPAIVREKLLRYRIEIEVLPKSGILRVADEYLAPLTSRGEVAKSRNAFLEKVGDKLHVRMEGQAHPTYFDLYLDHTVLSRPHYAPHNPHLVAAKEELSRCYFFYFEPRERMRAANPLKEVRHIGLMGEELAAFLNTLKSLDLRQFRGVEKALRQMIPSVTSIDVEVSSLGEVDLWLTEGNIKLPARVVSEGTLRVLGLLALGGAKDPPSLIGFEEPENGIHPRRVRDIAELLKTRAISGDAQLIVTTHSPTLLDLLPTDSLFTCRKENGRTAIESFQTWELGRSQDIDQALEEPLPVSQRMMRGDFDA